MIIANAYNNHQKEYFRYDDILENNIKDNKLNATKLEKRLASINKGKNRRLKNNHQQRLQAFKNK